MPNPFDDPDARFLVLVNDELQYSLWPEFAEVPAGWTVARPAGGRAESLAFIDETWTDMRPKSLADHMDRTSVPGEITDLTLSHVEMYVADATTAAAEFTGNYGFTVVAEAVSAVARSLALRQGRIDLVVTEALDATHPAAAFVAAHGDGIGDVALRTTDARAAFRAAVAREAVALAEPEEKDGWVTAVLGGGFDDVRHTLVQRPEGVTTLLPGFNPVDAVVPGEPGLTVLDHLAVTVRAGELGTSTGYYERVFGYHSIYQELMVQGDEAMDSNAVRSPAGDITFTVLAPNAAYNPGHIGDFLDWHGGGGVHHLAFATDDIVASVGLLAQRGVGFLGTPDVYYDRLEQRMDLIRHTPAELRSAQILADEDHDGQLYQIFTRSTHPRHTLFFEIIERIGAESFGGGNVRALYDAVQAEKSAQLQGAVG